MTGHKTLKDRVSDQASGTWENIKEYVPGKEKLADQAAGTWDSVKDKVDDAYDYARSHLPGSSSYEEAKRKAYEAAHPSTLQSIKNTAEYIKNRVVHGSQEAAHIAEDRAKEFADKAKYKTGL
jgi:hypothetical protein